ncbi:hypothetical protein [Pseudoroseicyclus tamaricis]|uniref:hypothetical protein n=1 Tax=Pseudoroseicyclus tamaricis TaxID=2705421 RepID=UPI00193F5B40|nr:hypothetical protein [Pseudoroseicyclus tamaricis]
MANASSKKYGPGQQDQGKGDGHGGMEPADVDVLPDNEILSNRDTSQHSDQRGLDSGHLQDRQYHEHVDGHAPGKGEPGKAADKDKLADERPEGKEPDGEI